MTGCDHEMVHLAFPDMAEGTMDRRGLATYVDPLAESAGQ